jgi:NADH:ubiquinone oxidoreductase subunit C
MLEREVRVKIKRAAKDLAAAFPVFSAAEWEKRIERALRETR